MSAAGDTDGDGIRDILAGAPSEDVNGGNPDVGNAHLYSGASGLFRRTFTASPANPGYQFGRATQIVPDFDGDGLDDIVIGAPFQFMNFRTGAGALYRITAIAQTRDSSRTPDLNGSYGAAIASTQDANGDGVSDLLIGAVNEGLEGRVHIIDAVDGDGIAFFDSPNPHPQDAFGTRLLAADLNGDGTQDWIVGVPFEDAPLANAGRVYAYNGATGGMLWNRQSPTPEHLGSFGHDLAAVGDITGDGAVDLLVGSHGTGFFASPDQAGRVYVLDGRTGNLILELRSPNEVEDGRFGNSVAGIGDTNGDGYDDWLVGAPGETADGVARAGRAYVFSGLDASLLFDLESPEPAAGGFFGWVVDGAGDLNGDAADDWVVSAPFEPHDGLTSAGHVYAFGGVDAVAPTLNVGASPTSLWPANSAYFGFGLAGLQITAGDLADGSVSADDVVITHVTSDEPEDMPGSRDGATTRDITITFDCRSSSVRAERDSKHNGRVYTMHLAVADAAGNIATATYRVAAPIRRDGAAIRDLDAYTVTGCDPITGSPAAVATPSNSDSGPPATFELEANAPNPFREATRIGYSLPEAADVRIAVYDLMGREVARLVDGPMEPGRHEARLEAGYLQSGTYLYRMEAGAFQATRRLTIAR